MINILQCFITTNGALRYLLFPHQTGWSPERSSPLASRLFVRIVVEQAEKLHSAFDPCFRQHDLRSAE